MERSGWEDNPHFTWSTIFAVAFTVLGFILPALKFYPPLPPTIQDALKQTHSKLGVETHPNSSKTKTGKTLDEKTKYNGHASSTTSKPLIESLWVYPIKSCRGIRVSRARVLPTGLEFDRLFTFAQLKSPFPVSLSTSKEEKARHKWEFITQRQFPLLATVDVELWQPDVTKSKRLGGGLAGAPGTGEEQMQRPGADESFVLMRFPWREEGVLGTLVWLVTKFAYGMKAEPCREVLLPVGFPGEGEIERAGYEFEEVTIWRDTVRALNMGRELPEELRRYLGVSNKLALFRVDPEALREVHRCAPTLEEAGYQPVTGFQDAYPLHILNHSSVEDLESRVAKDQDLQELDARRFRANIMLTNAPAYDEDSWKSIRFTPAASSALREQPRFHVSCRTVRCKMPNVNPDTGARHAAEPDKSLRKHREIDAGAPKMGCLGMQMTPLFEAAASGGTATLEMESLLEVGMSVEVLERGAHQYIKQ